MPNICTCSGSRVFVRVFVPKIEPQPSVVGSWDLCNVCFARVQRRSVHPAVNVCRLSNMPQKALTKSTESCISLWRTPKQKERSKKTHAYLVLCPLYNACCKFLLVPAFNFPAQPQKGMLPMDH